MALLKPLGGGQGYLKAGFLGFQGSGKTVTALRLAIGTRKHFKLKGPIAMYDTERGSDYVSEWVKKETGQELIGVKSRSFVDLLQFAEECISGGVSVALVDSVTHPWRELCDAYLSEINEKRKRRCEKENKTFYPLLKVEFQHWQVIKGRDHWQKWVDLYLNSPLHIIIAGRAGYEYEYQEPEDGGRKELIKSGVKMRVENEFGFEPSLLVEMERDQQVDKDGTWIIRRKATVLKDRFQAIDGKSFYDPTFESFLPHIAKLTAGVMEPVDTSLKTMTGADEEGNTEWHHEKKQREILCEEIQGEIVANIPGQSAEDKKAKSQLLLDVFGTRSWTAVENLRSDKLRDGLTKIRAKFGVSPASEEPPTLKDVLALLAQVTNEASLQAFDGWFAGFDSTLSGDEQTTAKRERDKKKVTLQQQQSGQLV